MRIERLVLERFGHFTDTELDLSAPEVRLHVVFGPNEAGKSTVLRAIGDLLFGIDRQTPFGFRHGYQALRIGAEIRNRDGRALAFKRRKADKNALLDWADEPLADNTLTPFLGGANRRLFEGLFGLNQEGLRAGGREMAMAQGDLGQMLFEAGSHIRGIGAVRKLFEDEADRLFRPQASKRVFNELSNAYQVARRRVEELTVRADDWERNEQALAEAIEAGENIHRRREALERRRARAERIQRILPLATDLREARAELAEVADAPDLPEDSESRYNEAMKRAAVALARLRHLEGLAEDVRREIAAIEVPERILSRAAEIEELQTQRGAVWKAAADLPKLRGEWAEVQARLEDLVRRLGWSRTAEDALAAIPSDTDMAELRRLVAEDAKLDAASQGARTQLDEAALALRATELALAAAVEPPETGVLALALEAAKARGDLETQRDKVGRDLNAASAKLRASLASLQLWNAEASALAAAPVPDISTVQRFGRDLDEAGKAFDQARERENREGAAVAEAERGLAALREQGDIPTEAAVAEVRVHRDLGWDLIRRALLDGEAVAETEIERFAPRPALARRYEQAVIEADALADRREREATRVQRHAHLTTERDQASARRVQAAEAVVTAKAALDALSGEWRAAWLAADIAPLPPREMEAWLAARARVLDEADHVSTLARDHAALEAAIDGAATALRSALTGIAPEAASEARLSTLVRYAEIALARSAQLGKSREELISRRRDQAEALAREEKRFKRAKADRQTWTEAWNVMMARLGLAPGTGPAAADTGLLLWQEVRRQADALESFDHRIRRMEEDKAVFADLVRRIVGDAAPELDQGDPTETAAELQARLQAAQDAARRTAEARKRLANHQAEIEPIRAEEADALLTLDLLRRQADCPPDRDLLDVIRRARRKAGLICRAARLEADIRNASDGLGLSEALAEAEDAEPEAIRAEIAMIKEDNAALLQEIHEIGQRQADAERTKTEMEQGRGAAAAAQDMQDAVTALEDCARRWMVLKTATFLLGQGIERFRKEQQGPLLARAGELFALLTRRSFYGFRLDYDLKDTPILIGVRADGATCPIEGMSEGTRDQLFLALRLAAVELYVGGAEPLPFVADDLFVNFDDSRTEAGLEALMTLGASTQVLLFTHHAHIAELARRKGGNAGVAVLPLVA